MSPVCCCPKITRANSVTAHRVCGVILYYLVCLNYNGHKRQHQFSSDPPLTEGPMEGSLDECVTNLKWGLTQKGWLNWASELTTQGCHCSVVKGPKLLGEQQNHFAVSEILPLRGTN